MSLQDGTGDSDSHKNRSKGFDAIQNLFVFEGGGSLKDRLLTAFIVLAVAVGLTVISKWFFWGRLIPVTFAAAVAVLSSFEVARLFARDKETLRYQPVQGTAVFLVLVLAPLAATLTGVTWVLSGAFEWRYLLAGIALSALLLMLLQIWEGRRDITLAARYGERWNSAYLLVSLCGAQLVTLAGSPHGLHLLWWMMAVAALNDAAAYFTGRALGRHKMAPAISPNKTLEGSIAGLIAGALAGVFFWPLIVPLEVAPEIVAGVALMMSIAAQGADLSKSYLKRLRGVKDTGAFFPGHGGVLDRFDALLGAAPVVMIFLLVVGFLV